MRISDWSSDVCSSDLAESLGHVAARSLSMNVARPGPYRTKERPPDRGPILLCPEPAHPGEAAPRASSPPTRRAATVSPSPRRSPRPEEHTSELPSLMRIPYAVFFLKQTRHTSSS